MLASTTEKSSDFSMLLPSRGIQRVPEYNYYLRVKHKLDSWVNRWPSKFRRKM